MLLSTRCSRASRSSTLIATAAAGATTAAWRCCAGSADAGRGSVARSRVASILGGGGWVAVL